MVQALPVVDGAGASLSWDAALTRAWQRLAPRVTRSAGLTRRHVTARAADMPCMSAAGGVSVHIAYDIGDGAALPGEPTRICLVDLPAGARAEMSIDPGADSAWLVIDGQADIGGVTCAQHDYQQRRAGGDPRVELGSTQGARLMWREARPGPQSLCSAGAVQTTRAGQMGWEPLADGISRCLLAPPQTATRAAYLVRLAPGAAAPAHRHGLAEECMLLEGEMFLDDLLLFGGDFQLARAGGEHHEASSEHGVLLVVHGDLDLDLDLDAIDGD